MRLIALVVSLADPIAVVVAGLLIGNHGRRLAMSERTRQHLHTFWELNDEVLNALHFVMLGLEVLVLTFTRDLLLAVTYVIVVFSILVQGLTVKSVVLRCLRERPGAGDCRDREGSPGTADSA